MSKVQSFIVSVQSDVCVLFWHCLLAATWLRWHTGLNVIWVRKFVIWRLESQSPDLRDSTDACQHYQVSFSIILKHMTIPTSGEVIIIPSLMGRQLLPARQGWLHTEIKLNLSYLKVDQEKDFWCSKAHQRSLLSHSTSWKNQENMSMA